jgi:hypothetical protein
MDTVPTSGRDAGRVLQLIMCIIRSISIEYGARIMRVVGFLYPVEWLKKNFSRCTEIFIVPSTPAVVHGVGMVRRSRKASTLATALRRRNTQGITTARLGQ